MRSISNVNAIAASPKPLMAQPRSPVPYLFGGLAAMLALIAFSLLLLACSYWRVSGHLDNNNNGGGAGESGENEEQIKVCEEKILVIMAGEVNPTFLATPVFTKASNFDELKDKDGPEKGAENGEKVKEEVGDDHQQSAPITETQDQNETT